MFRAPNNNVYTKKVIKFVGVCKTSAQQTRFLRDVFVEKTMANLSCSFASHCDTHCDISSRGNELLPLSSCSRDISAHLRQISVSQTSVSSEKELILARVGLFDESSRDFTICPKHRDKLGVKFNASIKCQHPLHGNRKGKRERGINLRMSKEIKNKWNVVVPVGAGKTLCLLILGVQLK